MQCHVDYDAAILHSHRRWHAAIRAAARVARARWFGSCKETASALPRIRGVATDDKRGSTHVSTAWCLVARRRRRAHEPANAQHSHIGSLERVRARDWLFATGPQGAQPMSGL